MYHLIYYSIYKKNYFHLQDNQKYNNQGGHREQTKTKTIQPNPIKQKCANGKREEDTYRQFYNTPSAIEYFHGQNHVTNL